MIEQLFTQAKAMHNQLFGSADQPLPTGDASARHQLERLYFIVFVQLVSHPDFRAHTPIGKVVAALDDYRSTRVEQADFQHAAQMLFLHWHAGVGPRTRVPLTSLCSRPGQLGHARDLSHLRAIVVNHLKWRLRDEWRQHRREVRWDEFASHVEDANGQAVSDDGDAGSETMYAELLEVEDPGAFPEAEFDSDVELLERPTEPDSASKVDVEAVRSALHQYGVRLSGGQVMLSEDDQVAVVAAAQAFFWDDRVAELDRQRLGVWGTFHSARADTFHTGGRVPATTSGYAKEAERLGLGRAKTVGDTINKKLGVGVGYSGKNSRATVTLRDQSFISRGWAPSADDPPASQYWKTLLLRAFADALAEMAKRHIQVTCGMNPIVGEYKR